MLTGDENIVDVDVSVFWLVKTGGAGDYLFNIQNPEGTVKAVAESAMREIVGRSDIQPILTAPEHRNPGAGADAEDARQLPGRHPDHAGADAEGRSARAGDRQLPRRAGGARRPRARAERGADLRQPRGPRGARPRGGLHPAGRSLSRADGRRGARRRPRASCRSTSNTRRLPTSRASASIWRRWSACSAAPTRSSWIPGRRPATTIAASCRCCRSMK